MIAAAVQLRGAEAIELLTHNCRLYLSCIYCLVCSVISVYTDEGYCKVAETFVLK